MERSTNGFAVSTDDFAGWLANHTNLALKGVIGIKAMSELAEFIGEDEDAKYYKVRQFASPLSVRFAHSLARTSRPPTSESGRNTLSLVMEHTPSWLTLGTVRGPPSITSLRTRFFAFTSRPIPQLPSQLSILGVSRNRSILRLVVVRRGLGSSATVSIASKANGTAMCSSGTDCPLIADICIRRATGNSLRLRWLAKRQEARF